MAKKAEQERTTLVNFILDTSGSMAAVVDATIEGFNAFVAEQSAQEGRVLFTLTLFDSEVTQVCSAVPIVEVAPLDRESYCPGGCTALFDAVGNAIIDTDRLLDTGALAPEQVVFVIMTDGYENASREFDGSTIFAMIDHRQEARGYEFVYLGANQDSVRESAAVGVRPNRNRNWEANPASVRETYAQLSCQMSEYRREGMPQRSAWFEDEN